MGNDHTTFEPRRSDCETSTGDVDVRAATVHRPAPASDPLTERTRAVWSAGDYDCIAAGFRHEAQAFVERLALTPGQHVLDAACGSGNLTIPAARTGARVTGFDLVPALVDAAAAWAAREELAIRFDQGTVEKLPYADAQFDVVLSMFGVMFAARPDRVAAELARVTRPGGRVALANWMREGFVGRMLATHVAYVPPPAGLPSPLLWGDESVIRERFDERTWHVTTTVRTLTFRYPHTPAGTAELFRTAYGPTVRAMEALDTERREQLATHLADLWAQHQRPGARRTEVDAEYLEVVAIRR
jgi:2-polyprenyl-3-methyl-5-hydroxy-6-metoxy-1,4-benzoquinol methylase